MHELAKRLHRGRVARNTPGEGELIVDSTRSREERHRSEHDGAMQPGENVFAFLAERETIAQLGSREDGACAVDLYPAGRLLGEGTELVEPEIELVRDVAEVAAAACGTPVIHLEVRHDSFVVDLDRLGVLPPDVEHGAGRREHRVGPQAVTEDLAPDLFFRERQSRPSVPGPHRGPFDQLDGPSLLDRSDQSLGVSSQLRRGLTHRRRGRLADVTLERTFAHRVLDGENRRVEHAAEHLERDSFRIAPLLGEMHVITRRDVAEEVALSRGSLGIMRDRLLDHPVDDLVDQCVELAAPLVVAWTGHDEVHRSAKTVELLEVLEVAEVPLQRREEARFHVSDRRIVPDPVAGERESRTNVRLLTNDLRRDVVVTPAVRDPTPENASLFSENDRFGRGRSEIDTRVYGQNAHTATFECRFCSSICR